MSEDTQGVNAAPSEQQSSSPEPQNVPKYRLDEEIAQKRQLQEQLNFAQQMLRQAVPQNRPQTAPQAEPDWLKQLREENPNAYKAFKVQNRQLQEQSAATFSVIDRQDRTEFLQQFGQDGAEKLQVVEQKLEDLRRRGVHNFNRGDIFMHLEGAESLNAKRTARAKPKSQPVQQAASGQTAPVASEAIDAPSSDPRSAGVVAGSSASPTRATESLEDMEKRLANQEF